MRGAALLVSSALLLAGPTGPAQPPPPGRGQAKLIGLVPKNGRLPPAGAI